MMNGKEYLITIGYLDSILCSILEMSAYTYTEMILL
ncbi:UNVERIFIED_ORG: hypothetical protein QFZ59_002196 [Bacillus sp. B2I3]|nr:hypothetical protein [Bacillus sp. B2I3]